MRKPVWVAIGVGAIIATGFVVFASCSGNGPGPRSTVTSGATSGPEAKGWTRKEIATALFEGDMRTSAVLGAVTGAVPDYAKPKPARIEVTEVRASEVGTLVRFTLKNVDGSDPLLSSAAFNHKSPLTFDIRDVALIDAAQNLRLQPYLGVLPSNRDFSISTCSGMPLQMSQAGDWLSATFPPLNKGTTTVALELAGFPLIEGLPVSRP